MNGPREQGRNRQHGQLVKYVLRRNGQGVSDHDFRDPAIGQALNGRAGQHSMRRSRDDFNGAIFEQGVRSLGDRSGSVNHVVNNDANAALDIADDFQDFGFVRNVGVAALVDDGQRRIQDVSPALGNANTPCVRGNHSDVAAIVFFLDMAGQKRQREQVVHRAIKETLDLRGVQVDGHQAVCASSFKQVSHQTCTNRFATTVLLVLASVGIERNDDRDALGRCTLERINHEQLLHDPLVHGFGVTLQHERIATTN